MKKSIAILSLVLALGLVSNQAKAQNVGFGIRGGVNFSRLTNTNVNFDKNIGFMLGLYSDIPIYNNLFIFQPEVLYTQKGFEYRDAEFSIDYVEFPLLFRVNFVNPSGILPFVYFGPYVAFKVNTNFPDVIPDVARDLIDVNSTNFGITAGAGIDFGHLDLGVRYDAGLTEVFEDADAKLGVLSIVAGFGF